MGADREYDFDLVSDKTFENAYQVLKTPPRPAIRGRHRGQPVRRCYGRFPRSICAGSAATRECSRWGPDEIVYKSAKEAESRTWRYEDIDNISSSGPFQLTITTFERAKLDYGNRKQFNFELKQRLEEARYNELWLRLNQSKGLKILNSYRQGAQ